MTGNNQEPPREEFRQYKTIVDKIRTEENRFYTTIMPICLGASVTAIYTGDAVKYSSLKHALIALAAAGLTALYVKFHALPQHKAKKELEAQKEALESRMLQPQKKSSII